MKGLITKHALYSVADIAIGFIAWQHSHWSVALVVCVALLRWRCEDIIEDLDNRRAA